MTEARASAATKTDPEPRLARLLGLAIGPLLVAFGALVAPSIDASAGAAAAIVFGGAVLAVVLPLSIAAGAAPSVRVASAIGAVAIACVAIVAIAKLEARLAGALVDFALVALASMLGGGLGRRIQHASHLGPACAVGAAADLASVLSPSGPTHAIAESPKALALLAVGFVVPGTRAFAPAVGFGDALFLAVVLGCAATHGLSIARLSIVGALAFAISGAFAALLGVPIPALVALGVLVLAATPEARRVRREDRTTTQLSVTLAVGVAIAVVVQRVRSR